MILTIDIGNTNINFGVFRQSIIVKKQSIPTNDKKRIASIKKVVSANKVAKVIICSVVPQKTKELKKEIKKVFKKDILIAGEDLIIPIKNLYHRPKQVGQDRLVNAYGGIIKYGAPLIIVDFGTAITFDVISKKEEYLGGMILPGLELSLRALFHGTALLPRVFLKQPKEFIGKSTKESILSGIVYGFAGLADSLIDKIQKKIGKNAKVIATGGNSHLIARYSKAITHIDPNLTLRALTLL